MLFLLSGLIANAQIHNNSINAIKFTLWPITQGKTHGLKTRHFIVRVELICDKAARINCFLFLKWDVIICCFFFTQLFDSFVHKIYACVQENMCTHVHLIRLLLSPLRVRIYTWDATNQNSFKFFFQAVGFSGVISRRLIFASICFFSISARFTFIAIQTQWRDLFFSFYSLKSTNYRLAVYIFVFSRIFN